MTFDGRCAIIAIGFAIRRTHQLRGVYEHDDRIGPRSFLCFVARAVAR